MYTEEEQGTCQRGTVTSGVGCRGFALVARADGSIDEAATATLIDAAKDPSSASIEPPTGREGRDLRAVDRVASALERLGCARVLSSGGAATARGGRSTLWALQKACGRRRIAVVVAGGVSEANAGLLVRDTGCTQLHAATALTHEVARAAPTSLFFATERVVCATASLHQCRAAAAAALNERRRRRRAWWATPARP